ncbi:MAG: hypothetical protein V3V49_12140 [Candidatus Krumholzibacteria bacterium]
MQQNTNLTVHKAPEDFGVDDHRKYLLEQYKMFSSSLEFSIRTMDNMNKFFITIMAGFVAAIAFVTNDGTSQDLNAVFVQFGPILGLAISVIWFLINYSYKKVLAGRYAVLKDMEEFLPAAPFKRERIYRGACYLPFFTVVSFVPIVFSVAFGLMIFFIFRN